jgi:hypothetical protein
MSSTLLASSTTVRANGQALNLIGPLLNIIQTKKLAHEFCEAPVVRTECSRVRYGSSLSCEHWYSGTVLVVHSTPGTSSSTSSFY